MTTEMYVTPRYTQWMLDGGHKTAEALRTVYYARKRDLKGRADGKGVFRGSLIGHPCNRLQALSYLGADQHDDRDKKFADAGTMRHYEWQEIGLSAGFLVAIEKRIRIGKFVGHVDGILDNGWVFELKTTNDFSFKPTKARRAAGAFGTIDEPAADHKTQVNMYLHALGAPKAVLMYEARNSLETAEHIIEYDRDLALATMMRIQAIYGDARIGVLPDMHPACTDSSNMRKYCNFAETCLKRNAEEQVAAWRLSG